MALSKVLGTTFSGTIYSSCLDSCSAYFDRFRSPQTSRPLPLHSHYRSPFCTLVIPYAPPWVHYYRFLSSHIRYYRLLFIIDIGTFPFASCFATLSLFRPLLTQYWMAPPIRHVFACDNSSVTILASSENAWCWPLSFIPIHFTSNPWLRTERASHYRIITRSGFGN